MNSISVFIVPVRMSCTYILLVHTTLSATQKLYRNNYISIRYSRWRENQRWRTTNKRCRKSGPWTVCKNQKKKYSQNRDEKKNSFRYYVDNRLKRKICHFIHGAHTLKHTNNRTINKNFFFFLYSCGSSHSVGTWVFLPLVNESIE